MKKQQTFDGMPEYAETVRTVRARAMQKIRERDARRIAAMGLPENHAHYRLGSLMTRPVPVKERIAA